MKEAFKKLGIIQNLLKVPKGQRNTFGKYNYRSAEDILEALKPLSEEHNVTFRITEELLSIVGIVYVSCTASMFDHQSGHSIESVGTAVIDFEVKGMHKPQQTGAASSYSKKYALGNLLLIDDTRDADTTVPPVAKPTTKPVPVATRPTTKPVSPVAKQPIPAITQRPVTTAQAFPPVEPATPVKEFPPVDAGAKMSGKESVKKPLTVAQKENFIKGIEQGKFDLVEKHLNNYAVDANSKDVTKKLKEAKAGKTDKS